LAQVNIAESYYGCPTPVSSGLIVIKYFWDRLRKLSVPSPPKVPWELILTCPLLSKQLQNTNIWFLYRQMLLLIRGCVCHFIKKTFLFKIKFVTKEMFFQFV
jgi:hypothetical protein